MVNELKVGEQYGVLKVEQIYNPDDYYKMIRGTNPDGQTRQLVTRGPGRQLAATRIPIRIPAGTAGSLAQCAVEHNLPLDDALAIIQREFYLATAQSNMEDITRWQVLLVKMPREGNLDNGLEWNAPGGTGEPGETAEEIARREFSEESDLIPLFTWSPFSPMQFASGIYDETQVISFVFVTGNPTKLVEGAKAWHLFPLLGLEAFAGPDPDETDKFVPIDGKVVMAVMYAVERLLKLV